MTDRRMKIVTGLNTEFRARLDASFYGGLFLGFVLGVEIGMWWLR